MTNQQKFNELTANFDIPPLRRDISKAENVIWLMRNVYFKNGAMPTCEQAVKLLYEIFATTAKGIAAKKAALNKLLRTPEEY